MFKYTCLLSLILIPIFSFGQTPPTSTTNYFFTTPPKLSSFDVCNNSTGSCTETHFVCANDEMIPHHRRCDGIEDCADGTDEYLCHTRIQGRLADIETSCIKCTCLKGSITITTSTSAAWRTIAFNSPRDSTLLTNAPTYSNKPCHPSWTDTLTLNVYKKKNKGCRGWVCCFRQEYCQVCNSGKLPTRNCQA